MINFILNNEDISTESPPGMVLLDFLRDKSHLTGIKEGCREGDCGACTILLGEWEDGSFGYLPVNSCLLPLGEVYGKHVVTIEGVNQKELTPIQRAFVDEGAIQCGFCTPGFIMSLTGYFINCKDINLKDAVLAVDGNICRCTGYVSIKRAIEKVCKSFSKEERNLLSKHNSLERIRFLAEKGFLPDYLTGIPERSKKLNQDHKVRLKHLTGSSILVAGGTDLFVQKPDELIDKDLRFISREKEMKRIRVEGNTCFIGAGATVEEIKNFAKLREQLPDIDRYFNLIASTPLRSRATLGGNIVNASPIGDLTILFLALNSKISLFNGKNRREIQLKDFFKGYKELDKREDEIIEYLRFPCTGDHTYFNFEKVSKRKHLDIASVNSALLVKLEDDLIKEIHISAGGVSPIPLYLSEMANFLYGRELTDRNILDSIEVAEKEISPISDVRGSEAYKRLLMRQLLLTHFITLFPKKISWNHIHEKR